MSLVAQCLRGSGPVPRSKIRFRLKARVNESGELRAAHIASVHASAGPSVPPAKQREERRAEWNTQRRQVRTTPALYACSCPRIIGVPALPACQYFDRNCLQVIKVPGGAVLRGCKKTRRKLLAHFQLRAGIHSQLRVIASLYVLRIFLTCLVGYSTPGYPSAPTPPAVQPPRALNAAPLPPLPVRAPAQPASMEMDWAPEAEPEPNPEPEPEPEPEPLEEDMAEVSMQRHGRAKQLVVFFGAAGIGTRGGWGADAVLRAYCKVVCRPRGTDQRRGRVVLVDEHRTSRVSSAVNGQQPCERQLNKRRATRPAGWKPPAGQVEQRLVRPAWSQQRDQPVRGMMWCPVVAPRKPPQTPRSSQEAIPAAASEPGPSTPLPAKRSKRSKRTKAEPEAAEPTKGKGKAAKAKPAPQPGRWLDRDCNAALNMQRIGESKWRPLELCFWPQQGALPAKGKEYPGLGYKRLRDKPPKAQQQQQQPAEAQ
ncbi:hypothetical protein QJQ45_019628 [Haematococcus lacustris]|nr:hypothetical protein QJQ45_019628 [Haematococcus lacustris]